MPSETDFQRLMISLHIPKTGGQSFMRVLESLTPHGFIPDYENRPISPDAVLRRIKQFRTDMARMALVTEQLRDREGPVIVHGHFISGKYRSVFPGAQFLTWLREPVERVCSHYAYWARFRKLKTGEGHAKMLTLEEFAAQENRQNIQSRFLAHTRLDGFDFLGITDQFERSLRLFAAWSATELVETPSMNRYVNSGGYSLSPEIRSRIEAFNSLDMDLYARGLERFEALCEEHGLSTESGCAEKR